MNIIQMKAKTRGFIAIIISALIVGCIGMCQTNDVHAASNALQVRYFNVEGDCTYMLAQGGGVKKSIVVDAGDSASGLIGKLRHSAVYPNMPDGTKGGAHQYEKVIDYMFITHAHKDHMNGLKALLESSSAKGGKGFVIRNLYVNCVVGTDSNSLSTIESLVKKYSGSIGGTKNTSSAHVKNKIINTYYVGTKGASSQTHLNAVKNITIASGLTATILPNLKKDSNTNNCSMMIKISAGKSKFIFAGDLYKNGIKGVLGSNDYQTILSGGSGDQVYLKLPHHASRRVIGNVSSVTNLEMTGGGSISDLYGRGVNVANYFTQTDKANGVYSYTNAQGKVFTGIKNYDEAFNKMIKGSSAKLIGIGNVKNNVTVNHSDTMVMFALVGLDEYHDVRPTDYVSKLRSGATKATSWGVPSVSSSAKTYQVNVSY